MTDTTSLLAVVRTNIGVTVLPRMAFPGDGSLCFVRLVSPRIERAVGVLTLKSRSLGPAAQIFREFAIEALKAQHAMLK